MGRGISSVIDVSGANTEDKVDDDVPKVDPPKDEDINDDKKENEHKDDKHETSNQLSQYWVVTKDHPLDNILGDIKKGVSMRLQLNDLCNYSAFILQVQPKIISDALTDEGWLLTMQEELN